MRIRRSLFATMVAGFALLANSSRAKADVIVYSISATASGQIGALTFTNALVTLSLTGNTTRVVNEVGYLANGGTAMIDIFGIGTATITNPMAIYAGPTQGDGTPFVTFVIVDSPSCLCGEPAIPFGEMYSNALVGYDLRSAFGPLTTTRAGIGLLRGFVIHTTLGDLTSIVGDNSVTSTGTFQAVVITSPEPSSFVLLITVGVVLVGVRARRASHAKGR